MIILSLAKINVLRSACISNILLDFVLQTALYKEAVISKIFINGFSLERFNKKTRMKYLNYSTTIIVLHAINFLNVGVFIVYRISSWEVCNCHGCFVQIQYKYESRFSIKA